LQPLDDATAPPRAASQAPVRVVVPHTGHISAHLREHLLQQRPVTVWFTGLSGAGKSTLAYALEEALHHQGYASFVLDGDNLRHRLNKDLGFSARERTENIRRVAEVAALMNEAGLMVFTALISPQQDDRAMAREIVGAHRFLEVHISTPLEVCEERDPKGLYDKARAGVIPHFTGVSAPYEAPKAPDMALNTAGMSLSAATQRVLNLLRQRGFLSAP
jgi:adenylylsulfate kinase